MLSETNRKNEGKYQMGSIIWDINEGSRETMLNENKASGLDHEIGHKGEEKLAKRKSNRL